MLEPLPIVLVVAVVAFAGWLSQRSKRKMDDYRRQLEQDGEYVPAPPPQKLTRAQRRIEEFRASVPPPPTPSIEDIARAEAEDLGLADLDGADGLPVNVLLLVWRRDSDVYERCSGSVSYRVADAVAPAEATVDDVQLVCDGELRPHDGADGNNPAV